MCFRKYSDYLQEHFGCRVHKIGIYGGFSCPNRDGTIGCGGCSYCNLKAFSPPMHLEGQSLEKQLSHGIRSIIKKRKVSRFLAYFQPGTNTHAPVPELESKYRQALSHPDVSGLCIGTRPDCLERDVLELLASLSEEHYIEVELGLESISDDTLKRTNRGHSVTDFSLAVKALRNAGIMVCAHVILGFPWENPEQWNETALLLSRAGIDFVKLHNLLVLRDTALATEYESHQFPLLSIEQYLEVLCGFLARLDSKIAVQRLVTRAPQELLVAPHWNISGSQFEKMLIDQMKEKGLTQGCLLNQGQPPREN